MTEITSLHPPHNGTVSDSAITPLSTRGPHSHGLLLATLQVQSPQAGGHCQGQSWALHLPTLMRSMLGPLMLPLRSTRKRISRVTVWRSVGKLPTSGQKFSISTGLWKMSLWNRF